MARPPSQCSGPVCAHAARARPASSSLCQPDRPISAGRSLIIDYKRRGMCAGQLLFACGLHLQRDCKFCPIFLLEQEEQAEWAPPTGRLRLGRHPLARHCIPATLSARSLGSSLAPLMKLARGPNLRFATPTRLARRPFPAPRGHSRPSLFTSRWPPIVWPPLGPLALLAGRLQCALTAHCTLHTAVYITQHTVCSTHSAASGAQSAPD